MIFKGLKTNSIKKQTETALSKRDRGQAEIGKLKSLGILMDATNELNIMSLVKIADALGVRSNYMQILGYKEEYREKDGRLGEANYFGEKSISTTGSVKSSFLRDFIKKDFDILIGFYQEDHPILNFVAASSKAKMKVGYGQVDNRINDLIIQTPSTDTDVFISELKKYLQILKII